MRKTDILILGAGPAGFAASILLSARGYSVEILDAAFFPRRKICGEFLNPQAVQWLGDHDLLPGVVSLNPFAVYGMKISDHAGNTFTGHYLPHDQSCGFAVLREKLDSFLVSRARAAGVQVQEGHRADRLLIDEGRVVGVSGSSDGERFEKRARFFIGADGRNNLIGRTFGWVRGIRRLRKYVFLSYFEPLPELDHFGEVHLVPNGYVGIAPITDRLANVALVIDESAYPSEVETGGGFLMDRISESTLRERFSGLSPVSPTISAGPLAFRTTRTSGHNTLLIGDACGFIDPFTGEGINHSLIGAEIAADVINDSFRAGRFEDSFLRRYDEERRRVLGLKYRMANLLQLAVVRPALARMLIRRFAGHQDAADTIISAVGGAIPEREVWNLRFFFNFLLGRS